MKLRVCYSHYDHISTIENKKNSQRVTTSYAKGVF